jgi:hypothetical protein
VVSNIGDAVPKTTIFQAGDTYDVRCTCGWDALDCDDLESAGRLEDLHRGDEHKEHAPHDLPTSSVPADLPDSRPTRQPWEFFDAD